MINRERPARFSWRRCLASWMVNGESDGGELEEKGDFLPFLPCLSLVLPSLPALSRLGSDLERAGAGGRGFVAALCPLRVLCNAIYGWTVFE